MLTVIEESDAAGSGGLGGRLSAGLVGCFSCSFAIVSASIGAGVSLEQIRRTASLKFPSSILLVTAALFFLAASSLPAVRLRFLNIVFPFDKSGLNDDGEISLCTSSRWFF